MKVIKVPVVLLLLVLVAAGVGATLFLGRVVKVAVEQSGPPLLGVPIRLEKADVSLLSGKINLRNLVIGNPDGFDTKELVRLGELRVDLRMKSLLSKRIRIHEILIDAPQITYEQSLHGSNLTKLQEQMSGAGKAEAKKDDSGTKVEITKILITNGKIGYSAPGMGSVAIPIPLPTIELNDIGKESGGASITEVIGRVFGAILEAIGKAVTSSGQLLGKGAKAVGGGVVKGAGAGAGGGAAMGAAGSAGDGVKKLFRSEK